MLSINTAGLWLGQPRTRLLPCPLSLISCQDPEDDLESMIWVLTYAIILHRQESLQASDKVDYKRDVVDKLHGSLSYHKLINMRIIMMLDGCNLLDDEPEEWIPDQTQCKMVQTGDDTGSTLIHTT